MESECGFGGFNIDYLSAKLLGAKEVVVSNPILAFIQELNGTLCRHCGCPPEADLPQARQPTKQSIKLLRLHAFHLIQGS